MFDEIIMDALKELINIGMGEAAASLSDLVGRRVGIRVPELRVMRVDEIRTFLDLEAETLGVYLAQKFTGPLTGKAILFYTEECSIALVDSLFAGTMSIRTITESARATLQEVGNILLVSCISRIGDVVEMPTTFEIPTVTVEVSEVYFNNLIKEMSTFENAIVVRNELTVYEKRIVGYLFILLALQGFEIIAKKLEQMLLHGDLAVTN